MRRSGERGYLTFERLDLGTENEALRIAHARDGRQRFLAQALVLSAQVKQRDRRGRILPWRFHRRRRYRRL